MSIRCVGACRCCLLISGKGACALTDCVGCVNACHCCPLVCRPVGAAVSAAVKSGGGVLQAVEGAAGGVGAAARDATGCVSGADRLEAQGSPTNAGFHKQEEALAGSQRPDARHCARQKKGEGGGAAEMG